MRSTMLVLSIAIVSLLTIDDVLATPVTWNFSGIFSISRGGDPLGLGVQVGDSFNGSLTFDDSLPNTFATYNSAYGFTINIGGHIFQSTGYIESSTNGPSGFLQLDTGTGPAMFSSTGYDTVATVDGTQIFFIQPVIAVDGVSGAIPSDASLLTPINWHWFQVAYQTTSISAQPFYGGDVVFTSAVSPIPEPDSYAMMLAGVGLICAMTRYKRNRTARPAI